MSRTLGNSGKANPPEVSVCVPNYNGEAIIKGCIESILSQDCDFAVEVILHDDASDDNSAELVRATFPDITVIESPTNVGFCQSNNRMAKAARGRFLLLLNNDTELMPGALSALHGHARTLGEPAILTLPQYDFATGALVDRGSLVDLFMNPVPNRDRKRQQVAMVMGSCLWIPKAIWETLGGFPIWFESLAEDLYLCTLARMRKIAVQTVNESGYRHRVGTSFGGGKIVSKSLSTTMRRRRFSERNKTYTLVLCYPAPWLYLILPLHVLTLLGEGFLLSIIKWNFQIWRNIYWNCICELWRNRRRLAEHRQAIQKERRVSALEFFSTTTLLPQKLNLLFRYGVPGIR